MRLLAAVAAVAVLSVLATTGWSDNPSKDHRGFGGQSITLATSATQVDINTNVTLTAELSDHAVGVPVQFKLNGQDLGSPVNSNAQGVATKTYCPTSPGKNTLKAVNASYTGSNTLDIRALGPLRIVNMPSALAANSTGKVPLCFRVVGEDKITVQSVTVNCTIAGHALDSWTSTPNDFRGGNHVVGAPGNPPANGQTNTYTCFIPPSFFQFTFSDVHRATDISCSISVTFTPEGGTQRTLSTGSVYPTYFLDTCVDVRNIGNSTAVDPDFGWSASANVTAAPYYQRRNKDNGQVRWMSNISGAWQDYTAATKCSYLDPVMGDCWRARWRWTDGQWTGGGFSTAMPYQLRARYDNMHDDEKGNYYRNEMLDEQHGVVFVIFYGLKPIPHIDGQPDIEGQVLDIRVKQADLKAWLFPQARCNLLVSYPWLDSGSLGLGTALNALKIVCAVATLAVPGVNFVAATGAYITIVSSGQSLISDVISAITSPGDEGGKAQMWGALVVHNKSGAPYSPTWPYEANADLGPPNGHWSQDADGSSGAKSAQVYIQDKQATAHETWNISHHANASGWAYCGYLVNYYGEAKTTFDWYPNYPNDYSKCRLEWQAITAGSAADEDWVSEE